MSQIEEQRRLSAISLGTGSHRLGRSLREQRNNETKAIGEGIRPRLPSVEANNCNDSDLAFAINSKEQGSTMEEVNYDCFIILHGICLHSLHTLGL